MKQKKLSAAQLKVLECIKDGGLLIHMPYMGWFRPYGYWLAKNTGKSFKQVTVDKLLDGGYLKRTQDGFKDAYATITDKGREAINETILHSI